ncbi:MAG: methyltransferase domain-containing protein [Steroidobacteraceae bacterium]
MTPTPYDQLRYPGKFYPQASPRRMAAVATLYGLEPPALGSCRVLELGCGEGGHLVPIAHALPACECLGVDLSSASIDRARTFAEQAAVRNCAFRAQDLTQFPADAGTFDYIIAHGLYSWVPEPVRQAVISICARHLTASGLAYISYNAYPGGHVRQILRDLTVFQTRNIDDPSAKIREARKVAELIIAAMPPDTLERHLFGRLLSLYRDSDALLRFDLLAEENDPVYFLDFMESAHARGLQFVAESSLSAPDAATLPEAVRGWLEAMPERLVREQYLDFIACRGFRQSILCRGGRAVQTEPSPRTLAPLYLRSSLTPLAPLARLDDHTTVTFRNALGIEVSCTEAVPKAAYASLGEAFPRALGYEALRKRICQRLGDEARLDPAGESTLVRMLLFSEVNGVVEVHAEPPPFTTGTGPKPRASLLARLQAGQGVPISVLGASAVMAADRSVRALLPLLDGSRDRAQLLAAWQEQVGAERSVHTDALERTLRVFADQGLLIN